MGRHDFGAAPQAFARVAAKPAVADCGRPWRVRRAGWMGPGAATYLALLMLGCVRPLQVQYRPPMPEQTYLVRRGDTLYNISRRHRVAPQELAALNHITEPRALRPGSLLRMPRRRLDRPRHHALAQKTPRKRKAPPPPARTPPYVPPDALAWPVHGVVTSSFGPRVGRAHDGIDIGAPTGTAVYAAASGEVMFASHHGGYGNVVILRHKDDLVTVYAHHEVNLVAIGQKVKRGEAIAKVGATGRATGPHLHFEVRRGTRPQNPLRYLPS